MAADKGIAVVIRWEGFRHRNARRDAHDLLLQGGWNEPLLPTNGLAPVSAASRAWSDSQALDR